MQTVLTFRDLKKSGEKIVMLTAYDYSSARLAQEGEVDLILVGDSLGMVVLGYETTLNVTMTDMLHHTAATRRGAPNTFIVADMPYMSYHIDLAETKRNAGRLITEAGANAVKLEGGSTSRLDAVKAIVDCEIPVCAHLGLTPQSVHKFGGYKIQGKKEEDFDAIIRQGEAIEAAGAFMLVIEGVPERLGRLISEAISIPTIGIGAGRYTDGQVLVYHDMLGLSTQTFKFVKIYAETGNTTSNAISSFRKDVKNGNFPSVEHVYYKEK